MMTVLLGYDGESVGFRGTSKKPPISLQCDLRGIQKIRFSRPTTAHRLPSLGI